jgi:uncharacterized protein
MDQQKITDHAFFKYLKCPAWLEKDLAEGDRRDALMKLLQEEGLLKERRLALLGDVEVSEVVEEDLEEGFAQTIRLMKEGAQRIMGGVLLHGHYVARPDLLERVEGRSAFGNWYYVAVDFKRSSTLKDEYIWQGVFYAYVLRLVQELRPNKGYVIHANGTRSSFLIEDHWMEFQMLFNEIKDVHAGNRTKHFLNSGYKQSPYFEEFLQEVVACDDLSLLNRVWKSEVYALQDAGIRTVEDLANASIDRLGAVDEISMDRLYFLQQQAIALKENRIIVITEPEFAAEPEGALVIDIESDPLRDADYLFGVLEIDSHGGSKYHAFFADTEADLEANWKQFVEFLEHRAHKTIYHYGWYEVDVFRRLAEQWGAPEAVKVQFEERMVDVIEKMRNHVIFPLPFYSLKDIAQNLGFEWRADDASGLNSILWYEKFLEKKEGDWKKRIVEYNEDDVRATWLVRNWAIQHGKR